LEKQFRVALVPKRVRWREPEFDGGCASFIRVSSAAGRLLPAAGGDVCHRTSRQRDRYDPEMTMTISPFGGWAS
jgi:hypothetical protein